MLIRTFSLAVDGILERRTRLLAFMATVFLVVVSFKFAVISFFYARGVRGVPLRIQDSVLDGCFAVLVVWLVFKLLSERNQQLQTKIQAIADLHERLQNVLYAVVQIKDEASDEDIADFMHALDKTSCTLRELVQEHKCPHAAGSKVTVLS
jgi:hypothetical protein